MAEVQVKASRVPRPSTPRWTETIFSHLTQVLDPVNLSKTRVGIWNALRLVGRLDYQYFTGGKLAWLADSPQKAKFWLDTYLAPPVSSDDKFRCGVARKLRKVSLLSRNKNGESVKIVAGSMYLVPSHVFYLCKILYSDYGSQEDQIRRAREQMPEIQKRVIKESPPRITDLTNQITFLKAGLPKETHAKLERLGEAQNDGKTEILASVEKDLRKWIWVQEDTQDMELVLPLDQKSHVRFRFVWPTMLHCQPYVVDNSVLRPSQVVEEALADVPNLDLGPAFFEDETLAHSVFVTGDYQRWRWDIDNVIRPLIPFSVDVITALVLRPAGGTFQYALMARDFGEGFPGFKVLAKPPEMASDEKTEQRRKEEKERDFSEPERKSIDKTNEPRLLTEIPR
jgi:hypothetical protein